jgi:hypothetical protein
MSQGFHNTQVTLQAAATALANSASRTSLTTGSTQGRYTLPANALKNTGDMLIVEAMGIISTVVTTPGTLTLDWALGGTANCSTGAMTLNIVAQTNTPWFLRMLMTAITVGSGTAAQLRFGGFWLSPASINVALGATGPGPGGQIIPYSGTATGASTLGTTFDSTVSQQADIYGTFSVANAANSIQLLQYNVTLATATGF